MFLDTFLSGKNVVRILKVIDTPLDIFFIEEVLIDGNIITSSVKYITLPKRRSSFTARIDFS